MNKVPGRPRSGLTRAKFFLLLWRQWLADVAAGSLLSAPHIATMWAIDVLVILNRVAMTCGDSKGLFALLTFLDTVHSEILRREDRKSAWPGTEQITRLTMLEALHPKRRLEPDSLVRRQTSS